MTVLRPQWLVALIAVAVAGLLVTIACSQTAAWRRWWRPALWSTVALSAAALALASPAMVTVGERRPLAIAVDVSPSMGADDVGSTRLAAVKRSLVAWLSTLPSDQRVSLVSFSGEVTQLSGLDSPSRVARVVGSLALGRSTALGHGLVAAADTLGGPGTVVLLSDGTTNVGLLGQYAGQRVGERGVVLEAIAIGTQQGVVTIDGQSQAVPVDDSELKAAAAAAGGRFTATADAASLTAALEAVQPHRGRTPLGGWMWALAGVFGCVGAVRGWMAR